MKTLTNTLIAAMTGAVLSLATTAALADGHRHGHHWKHDHHRHYRAPVVYAPYYPPRPVYYAPPPVYYAPPPPVVYQPNYYAPRPTPAITVGISPIVIPLR